LGLFSKGITRFEGSKSAQNIGLYWLPKWRTKLEINFINFLPLLNLI